MPTPKDPVTAYAKRVVAKRAKIVVGSWHRLACQRHLDDLARARKKSRDFPYVFDAAHAKQVIELFPVLFCHSKGEWGEKRWCADCRHEAVEHKKGYCAHKGCDCDELERISGAPFELAPFQQFLVGSIFGWKHRDTGFRRFRRAYITLGRKCGKSPLASAVALFTTFCDGEPGAEGYAFATTRDQAKIVWDEARRMVEASPTLSEMIQVHPSTNTLTMGDSIFRPLGKDKDTADGKNMHVGIIDELHAHSKPDLIRVVENSTSARRQPLVFEITYAGTDQTTLCWRYDEMTQRILEGTAHDETHFGFIARLDESDDWEDERKWPKANPMLGVTPKIEDLRAAARKARLLPSEENDFLRSHMNMWTAQEDLWLPMRLWDACEDRLALEDFHGADCFAGLDLGGTRDLSALTVIFDRDQGLDVFSWFWCPTEAISARAGQDVTRYQLWADEGWITRTPGSATDFDQVEREIASILEPFHVLAFPFDKTSAEQLAQGLQKQGLPMIRFGQSYENYTPATYALEALLLEKKIRHGRHPVLRWNAQNVMLRISRQNPKHRILARRADDKKIDGIAALCMAIGARIRHESENEEQPLVYADASARPDGFLEVPY